MNLLQLLLVPLIVEALIPPEFNHRESIPREFVFKTISPPPPTNNKLYRALFEAPFHRGPFPAEERMNSAVLAHGVVYHLAEGGWIMCQDGCVDCEICEDVRRNRVVPTAKWTLKRIISGSRRPYHLQLTLLPRGDDDVREKNTSAGYIHETSRNGALGSLAHHLIIGDERGSKPGSEPYHGGSLTTTTGDVRTRSRLGVIPGRKRGREMRGQRLRLVGGPTTPSILFHPDEEAIRDDCPMGNYPRFVLSRNPFGKKRLVHGVPATGNLKSSSHPDTFHQAHLERPAVFDHEGRTLYQKILRRVIDSLNTNKAAIDKFLLSSSLDEHASPSPSAGNVLPVESEPPSSSIDTTWYDDRIEQDNEETIRQVVELTHVRPKTDIDFPEDNVVTATAHDDLESGSNMNIDSKEFHEETFRERNSFGGLSAEGSDGSGSTLILKEVAKSVVDHPSDTLQGFNLLTNTATTTSRH